MPSLCPIPYKPPKPNGKTWSFVTDPDKKASPQVSKALTALSRVKTSELATGSTGWRASARVASWVTRHHQPPTPTD